MKHVCYKSLKNLLTTLSLLVALIAIQSSSALASNEQSFSGSDRELFHLLQEKLLASEPSVTSSTPCPKGTGYFPHCYNVLNRGIYVGMGVSTDGTNTARPTLTKFCQLLGYDTFKPGSGKYSTYSSYNDELIVKLNPSNGKWEKASTNAFWTGFTCINTTSTDTSSSDISNTNCNDTRDNDDDGYVDSQDAGCQGDCGITYYCGDSTTDGTMSDGNEKAQEVTYTSVYNVTNDGEVTLEMLNDDVSFVLKRVEDGEAVVIGMCNEWVDEVGTNLAPVPTNLTAAKSITKNGAINAAVVYDRDGNQQIFFPVDGSITCPQAARSDTAAGKATIAQRTVKVKKGDTIYINTRHEKKPAEREHNGISFRKTCSTSPCDENKAYTSSETDNEKEYYKQGTTSYTKDGKTTQVTDECVSTQRLAEYYATTTPKFDSNDKPIEGRGLVYYNCPYGCHEGACKHECETNDDCTNSAKPVCNPSSLTCEACPSGKVYNTTTKTCTECVTNANCPSSKPVCNSSYTCEACPSGKVYDSASETCVQCTTDNTSNCQSGQICSNNTCTDVYTCSKSNHKVTRKVNSKAVETQTDSCTGRNKITYKCADDQKSIIKSSTTCQYGCNADGYTCKEVECDENDDSNCEGETPVCDIDTNTCVECLVNSDCIDPLNPVCNQDTNTCEPCEDGTVYDSSTEQCVECTEDDLSQCEDGQVCSNNTCQDKYTCSKNGIVTKRYKNGKLAETRQDNCSGSTQNIYKCSSDNKSIINNPNTCRYGCSSNGLTCNSVECTTSEDCTNPDKPKCENNSCVACQDGTFYNEATDSCVECTTDNLSNCAAGQACVNFICQDVYTCSKSNNKVTRKVNGVVAETQTDSCSNKTKDTYKCSNDNKSIIKSSSTCQFRCSEDGINCDSNECNTSADCADPTKPVCNPSTKTCEACPSGTVYNTTIKTCTECVTNDNCPSSKPVCNQTSYTCEQCTDGVYDSVTKKCVECLTNANCPSNEPVCNQSTKTCEACPSGSVYNTTTKTCTECVTNDNCPSSKPVCNQTNYTCEQCADGVYDSVTKKCVECLTDTNCPSDEPVCNQSTKTCEACPSGTVYNTTTKTCTECVTNDNCSSEEPVCNQTTYTCETCPDGSVYNTETKTCVECLIDDNCSETQKCEENVCVDKYKAITPILDCIMDNEDGTYSAYFGYENTNDEVITIKAYDDANATTDVNDTIGGANYAVIVGPGYVKSYGKQISTFEVGRVKGAFSIPFKQSEKIRWRLKTNSFETKEETADASSVKCAKVTPAAKCISINADGSLQAYFGYTNNNDFEVTIPVGARNNINPDPEDRGQPVQFLPGNVANVFDTKLDEPSTAWYLDGVSVSADKTLPTCTINNKPTCEEAEKLAYNTDCQGTATILDLDATGCVDPDGTKLSYSWKTDCEDALLTNENTANATLQLTIPGTGVAQTCTVKVTVTDGLEIASATQNVNVTACNVDCPGTDDQKDQCGVCGGDGTSCLDCAGVPFGDAKLDKCDKCNGNNECLDCFGVPYGPAKEDRCGICGGDGSTCIQCTETSIKGDKAKIHGDEFVKMLKQQTELLLKEAKPYPPIREIQSSADRRINRAEKKNAQIKSYVLKLSDVIKSCTDTKFCTQGDNEPTLEVIARYLRKLRRQVGRTIRQRNINNQTTNKLLNQNTKILNEKLAILDKIPRFYSECE